MSRHHAKTAAVVVCSGLPWYCPIAATAALFICTFAAAVEMPPPLPPSVTSAAPYPVPPADGVCRCDVVDRCRDLEVKLNLLIEMLIRKGVIDRVENSRSDETTEKTGGGTSTRPSAGIATPPVLVRQWKGRFAAPIPSLTIDGRAAEWRKVCNGGKCHYEYR